MFCQKCGTEFEGKFCPNCGTPAAGSGQAGSSSRITEEADVSTTGRKSKKKKKGKGKLIPAIIVVALLVSCGALFGAGSGSSNYGSGKSVTMENSHSGAQSAGQGSGETQDSGDKEASAASGEDNGTAETGSEAQGTDPGSAAEADGANASGQPAAPSKVVEYAVRQEYFYDRVNSIGSHVGSAFVEIENTGTTALYLHDGKFDIEDNNGHLLKTESLVSTCPDAILPGELGYFYDDYIDLDDIDASNGLVFVPHYKVEEARREIIDYDVSDLDIREDPVWKCMVTGRLTNSTEKDLSYIYIYAVYYDADGNTIGISGTNLTDIAAGDTESFQIIGQFFRDDVTLSDIARYTVVPRDWYMQF